jgi:hypothetical protein
MINQNEFSKREWWCDAQSLIIEWCCMTYWVLNLLLRTNFWYIHNIYDSRKWTGIFNIPMFWNHLPSSWCLSLSDTKHCKIHSTMELITTNNDTWVFFYQVNECKLSSELQWLHFSQDIDLTIMKLDIGI